ncbi:PIR protein [Plasmodium vivax]|nr:PIR protein [Plasmodium vivax]
MVVSQINDKFEYFNKVKHEELYKALKYANSDSTDRYCTGECPYIALKNFATRDYDNLCEKLNKFISYLCYPKGVLVFSPKLNTNDYEYLNYWLNLELENKEKNFSELKKELSKNMNNDKNSCFNKEIFKQKLNHIEKSDFEYMNILDNLYKDYAEIRIMLTMGSDGPKRQCYEYSKKCSDNYELAIKKYPDRSTDFYKALQKFKEKYASLHNNFLLEYICSTKELKKIRSDDEILATATKELSEPKGKNSTVTNILVPTIGVTSPFIFIYMFTPFGTWIRTKIKPRNNVISQSEKRHHPQEHTYDTEKNNDAKSPYNISYAP